MPCYSPSPSDTMLKLKKNYRCVVQHCGWVGGRVQATVIAFAYGCFFAYDNIIIIIIIKVLKKRILHIKCLDAFYNSKVRVGVGNARRY